MSRKSQPTTSLKGIVVHLFHRLSANQSFILIPMLLAIPLNASFSHASSYLLNGAVIFFSVSVASFFLPGHQYFRFLNESFTTQFCLLYPVCEFL